MRFWYGWPFPWLHPILDIVLIIAIVLIVIAILRGFATGPVPRRDSALEILRERFARGEITQAEYEETRKALERR